MSQLDVFTGRQTWSDYITGQEIEKTINQAGDRFIKAYRRTQNQKELSQRERHTALESWLNEIGSTIRASQDQSSYYQAEMLNASEIGFENVVGGLDRLNASYNLLMGDVVWKLEMQQETLIGILSEIRLAEFEREARAYRIRGEDSYLNGWYKEALEDFLEAEKRNYKDFAVLRSVANIYLYHLIDLPNALNYFRSTAKYARPNDARQAAEAEYFAGIVCGLQHDKSGGLKHLKEAVLLNPELYDAYYMLAGFASMLGDTETAIGSLEKGIRGDLRYYLRVQKDGMFDQVRSEAVDLLTMLKDEYKQRAREAIDRLNQAIETAKRTGAQALLAESVEASRYLEQEFRQEDIFAYNGMVPRVAGCHEHVFKIAEHKIKEIIDDKRSSLIPLQAEKEQRIAKIEQPIQELERQRSNVRCGMRYWSLGCASYAALWFAISMSTVMLFISWAMGNPNLQFVMPFIAVPFWFLSPLLITKLANALGYFIEGSEKQSFTKRIQALEIENKALKKDIEQEFEQKKAGIDKEIRELEARYQRCERRQYF